MDTTHPDSTDTEFALAWVFEGNWQARQLAKGSEYLLGLYWIAFQHSIWSLVPALNASIVLQIILIQIIPGNSGPYHHLPVLALKASDLSIGTEFAQLEFVPRHRVGGTSMRICTSQ